MFLVHSLKCLNIKKPRDMTVFVGVKDKIFYRKTVKPQNYQ